MTGRSFTIGVMGGMGPAATADFMRRLAEVTPAQRDQDHVRVVVDSDPRVPDRTAFLLGTGEDPRPALIRMAQGLERAGADLLVMACNTAYAFAGDVAASVTIPLADWPGIVADEVRQASATRVGLLATSGTIVAGIYQTAFADRDLELVVPTDAAQQDLMRSIYGEDGVKAVGTESRLARARAEVVAGGLVMLGANALVIGCTELSALNGARPLAVTVPVHDASQVVARHVVALATGFVAEGAR